ncbi:MAG: 4-alpha-glucanotransferase [Alphaproteobacteria bacterium]|nr:4-alpha-glucanotransferase [Alphaproteobacteria bacterium]
MPVKRKSKSKPPTPAGRKRLGRARTGGGGVVRAASKLAIKDNSALVRRALRALGHDEFALIIHSSCFPTDTAFGTINSKSAHKFLSDMAGVFNAIQLGPEGLTSRRDPSPYTGTLFSLNPLSIDLEKVVSAAEVRKICAKIPGSSLCHNSYVYSFDSHKETLSRAAEKFVNTATSKQKEKFGVFVKNNASWLATDALYEALSIENKSDNWEKWPKSDREILQHANSFESQIRISEIESKYAAIITAYKYTQFIAAEQQEATRAVLKKLKIKSIGDRQVSFSARDIWANQHLFIKNICLGAPPDVFSKTGQAWGFPVLDPKKMFAPGDTLGPAGLFLKNLYKKMFAAHDGGLRIDHAIGVIDPWVYKKGLKPTAKAGAGRLYSSPKDPALAKYVQLTTEDYARPFTKIIFPAALDAGVKRSDIICEDLGVMTAAAKDVFENLKLVGMKVLMFANPFDPRDPYALRNIGENSVSMIGTHDNEPLKLWAKNKCKKDPAGAAALATQKLADLFASKSRRIQISFLDYFGMEELYNQHTPKASTSNWSLRVPNDYKARQIDLIEPLKLAVESRGFFFRLKHRKLMRELENA